jgi:NAD(P)-dependent dehydrogenase (short-subunit alcohol dehydrogenase family)
LMSQHGAKVVLMDLPGKGAPAVAAELNANGGQAIAHEGDISEAADVTAAVRAAVANFDTVHSLINVAALTGVALSDDLNVVSMPIEKWDRNFAVNVRGTMLCCREVLPIMLANGNGSIVNVSSLVSLHGHDTLVGYGSAKAGVNHLTLHIAAAFGKQGIRCNAILPGLVLNTNANPAGSFTDQHVENSKRNVFLNRLGEPEDIANLAVFLASDEVSSFMTGQLVCCDGGQSAH